MSFNGKEATRTAQVLQAKDAQQDQQLLAQAEGASRAAGPDAGAPRRFGQRAAAGATAADVSQPAVNAPAPRAEFHRPPVQAPSPTEGLTGGKGYINRVTLPNPGYPGMSLRLERLIDEVSAARGMSPERVAQIKAAAVLKPKEAEAAYLKVYEDEIRPVRQTAARSVGEAIQKNPNQTVFVVRRGKDVNYEVRPARGPEAVLHGAVIESVSPLDTPFRSPEIQFQARDAALAAAETQRVAETAAAEAAQAAAPVTDDGAEDGTPTPARSSEEATNASEAAAGSRPGVSRLRP